MHGTRGDRLRHRDKPRPRREEAGARRRFGAGRLMLARLPRRKSLRLVRTDAAHRLRPESRWLPAWNSRQFTAAPSPRTSSPSSRIGACASMAARSAVRPARSVSPRDVQQKIEIGPFGQIVQSRESLPSQTAEYAYIDAMGCRELVKGFQRRPPAPRRRPSGEAKRRRPVVGLPHRPAASRTPSRRLPANGGKREAEGHPGCLARHGAPYHQRPSACRPRAATSGSAARSARPWSSVRQPLGLTKAMSWRRIGRSRGLQREVTDARRDLVGLQPASTFLAERSPAVVRIRHVREEHSPAGPPAGYSCPR